MKLVGNYEDIQININTIDKYLISKKDPEYTYALDLVKKGICFLTISAGTGYKFYPSRFIGYKNNTMKNHLNSLEKDGRVTTPIISSILGKELDHDGLLDNEYKKYCEELGIEPTDKGSFGVERRFWLVG